MHETPDDVAELQTVLDGSYEGAGKHLLSIHTPNWRMSAQNVVDALTGMCVLNLATVNSRGEPIQGPVDGMFYRARFFCGSSRDSLRARHIAGNPAVSIAHVRGEELAVVVHGTALEVHPMSERGRGFHDYIVEIYGREMTGWEGSSVVYWEVEPRKMFALAPQV